MTPSATLKRSMLYGFAVAIAVAALCGIWALLTGTWGWLEARVLMTAGVVGGASVLALSGAAAWEARRWRLLGAIAVVTVGVASAMVLGLIWEPRNLFGTDLFWKAAAVASIAGVAMSHASMLGMARLRKGHEWVRLATVGAVAALALLTCWLVATEGEGIDSLVRVIGIIAIADAAGTITVPILHRLARVDAEDRRKGVVTTARTVLLHCPRCSRERRAPLGRSACEGCGLVTVIELEEEHCPSCGYVVFGLKGSVCPECGAALGIAQPTGARI